MNILFYYSITVNPKHGGIAKVTLFLCRAFQNMGHRTFIISSEKTQDDVVDYQYYLPDGKDCMSNVNQQWFTKFIKENKIDICINQNGNAPDHNEAISWCNFVNLPVITVVHNTLHGMYGLNGKCKQFHGLIKRAHAWRLIDVLLHYYFKKKYGKWYKYQGVNSNKIVLLSDLFKSEYKYYSGVYGHKVVSIPNILTIENWPDEIPDNKEKEIIYVGRISPEKQIDVLLKIWGKISSKYKDWRLTIVGGNSHGCQPLFDSLKQMAKDMALERCSFEGYKDPIPYYSRASIFCMTSSFEGFGLVLTEAMAYGTVPLAFNSYQNVSEIIDHGENGMLVTAFSIDEYAEKISYLIDNEDYLKKLSRNAHKKANQYKSDVIAKKWIVLFNEMISSKKYKND